MRDADDKFLKCIDKYKNEEPYYTIGKKGISGKMTLEDFLPDIAKNISGNYFGRQFKLN